MTNEQQQVREWMLAFSQECPTSPTIPSLEVRKLRAKLILEETLETTKALGFIVKMPADYLLVEDEAWKGQLQEDRLKEILDGCEDLKVVTEGCLVSCGLLHPEKGYDNAGCYKGEDPHFNEVMRSNWTKLWTLPEIKDQNRLPGYSVTNTTSMNEDEMCNERCYLVKDSSGKVIKSPSYSPPQFKLQ